MTPAWRRRARPLLGTLVEIRLPCHGDDDLARCTEPAFARIRQFHDAMSRHEPSSDVGRIEAAAAGETVAIRRDTWAVLSLAIALEHDSDGVFDIAVPPWAPRRSAGASLRLHAGEDAVTVLAPVQIDLGGIAKGAAVDAAVDALRTHGVAHAIVNAGGDLAVLGEQPQPVVVRGPGGSRLDAGTLADGAIATSGPFDGSGGSRLSLPADGIAQWPDRTVSVIAPRCAVADALTKVVAVLGQAAGPLLARHRATALSVDGAGRVELVPRAGAVA